MVSIACGAKDLENRGIGLHLKDLWFDVYALRLSQPRSPALNVWLLLSRVLLRLVSEACCLALTVKWALS